MIRIIVQYAHLPAPRQFNVYSMPLTYTTPIYLAEVQNCSAGKGLAFKVDCAAGS